MENAKILIVQTAFIGDVILITPLIRAVSELYPKASIDAMVVPAAAKLLENNPHLKNVIPYAKRKTSLWQMAKLLKAKGYDLVISPHSSGRTHLLLWLSGIKRRIGFDRSWLPFLLTDKVPHPTNMHKIKKNLLLLKFLSPNEFEMRTELFPSEQDKHKAENLLQPFGNKPLIAIAPGSIWATKCWLLERYVQLAQELVMQGYGIVLIGGEGDKDKCDEVEKAVKDESGSALNLAGKTNLLESAAIIARCNLMLCNDSGALHIANAMQTRVFAFFGPTVQSIGYFPYRDGDRVFETELGCRPCGSHGPQKCPLKHHDCMRKIEVQPVLEAIMDAVPKIKS
jgi:heptosyltransferase-2